MISIIKKYFTNLSDTQRCQFESLMKLYPAINDKVNLISRRDIDNLEVAHLLHSLAIAKFIDFKAGSRVMDLGTGGGLPGIPLAIMFPEVQFHLIDRIGKKVNAAKEIAEAVELKNVTFQHGDSGECHDKFDFVVSRAVMPQADVIKAVRKNISSLQKNSMLNGIITLKGGDLNQELKPIKEKTTVVDIKNIFTEDFFDTKKIVYTQI
jgi:16S rRNA (guanine527-N7)-methyltransferase